MYAPGTKARRVLDAVPVDKPITLMELFMTVGLPPNSLKCALRRLDKEGAIAQMGRHRYQRCPNNDGLIVTPESSSS